MSKLMRIVLLLIVAASFYCQNSEPDVRVTTFSENGAWCWFQDPRAVYVDGNHQRTYAGWITNEGQLQAGSYDHQNDSLLIHTIKENWGADDHNTCSFLVLPDRRLMIFYTRHGNSSIFCRTAVRPEDISEWEDEVRITDHHRETYSHPAQLKSENNKLYVFWRGSSWKPEFSTSMDGVTWTEPRILIQQKGREERNVRPYLKVASDNDSTIHFAFTDGHPRVEPENSLYYLKYKDGMFYKADGTPVGSMDDLPIQHSESDLVYDATQTGVRAWVWDIALDSSGYPVIVYTRLPSETDHRYHYARWDGKKWLDSEIVAAGSWFPETPEGETEPEPHYSGGVCLDPARPGIVYLSRKINGIFEIEQWTTSDSGRTWSSLSITQHSDMLNVRPVVPRGYQGTEPHVLWMTGHYRHYTDFDAAIRMAVPAGM